MQKKITIAAVVVLIILGAFLVFRTKKAELTNIAVVKQTQPYVVPAPAADLQSEIVIGAVLSLSGDKASVGSSLKDAITLAVDDVNAAKGFAGKKVSVVFVDGACDEKTAAAAAQDLVANQKATMLIGGACDGNSKGVAYVAKTNKVIAFDASSASADLIARGGGYFFSLASTGAASARAEAAYAVQTLKAKRAVVLSAQGADAQAERAAFVAEFKKDGGVVVLDRVVLDKQDSQVQAAKDAVTQNADVMYVAPTITSEAYDSMQGILGELSLTKIKADKFPTVLLSDKDYSFVKPIDKMDILGTLGVVMLFPTFDKSTDLAQGFIKEFAWRYNAQPEPFLDLANANSIVYLARDLIQKDGGDSAKIQKTLSTLINGWSGGAWGSLTLDASGSVFWKTFEVKQYGAETGLFEKGAFTLK